MLVSFFNTEILASFIPNYNTLQCGAGGISLPEHHYPQALCQGVTLHRHSYWGGWACASLEPGGNGERVDMSSRGWACPHRSLVSWVCQGPVSHRGSRSSCSWQLPPDTSMLLEITSDLSRFIADLWVGLLEWTVLSNHTGRNVCPPQGKLNFKKKNSEN